MTQFGLIEINKRLVLINSELALKLDSSDYNATDVLSKLLTVDGPGSLLEADLVDGLQGSDIEQIANKGVAGGYTPLNGSGQIDAQYLPSYVDDVIEVETYADLPVTGETSKLYIVKADETQDDNDTSTYRWSGTVYVLIANQIGTAEILGLLSGYTVSPITPSNKLMTEADVSALGGGDMLKSVYDDNDDGIVNESDYAANSGTVNGLTVETAVPPGAVFTDTTYTSDDFALEGLSDTSFTSKNTNDVQQWNGSAWVNVAIGSASGIQPYDVDTVIDPSYVHTDSNYDNTAKGKVDNITVTQPVDLDTIESRVNALDAAVVLTGEWDASVGSFPISTKSGESWIVSEAGTVDSVDFNINDRIVALKDGSSTTIYATEWLKLDYTDQVLSVNSQTGTVVLDADDIDDTSTVNKFVDSGDIVNLSNLSGVNTGDQVSSDFDHDQLTNYVANQHIDWTTASAGTIDPTNYVNTTYLPADPGTDGTDGTDGLFEDSDKFKLDSIEAGAEVNNISDVNATDLTDSGDSALHYHSSDRNRANHIGTQTAATISDFDTEVSNNADVAANTAARHTAATLGTKTIDETDLTNGYVISYNGTSGNLEYIDVSGFGTGDMLKSVYDGNDDGTVDAADYAANAGTVNSLTVETAVPVGAVFTDTTYSPADPGTDGTDGTDGLLTDADKFKLDSISTGVTADQNVFTTISVAGQNDVIADSTTDTLTFVAGTNVTITTDDVNDTITFDAAPGTGSTNLSVTNKTATTLDVASDIGTDATIPEATVTEAGLLNASDKTKLQTVALTNVVNTFAESQKIEHTYPSLDFTKTDAVLDQKTTRILETTNAFSIRNYYDDLSAYKRVYESVRSGVDPISHTFYIGDNAALKVEQGFVTLFDGSTSNKVQISTEENTTPISPIFTNGNTAKTKILLKFVDGSSDEGLIVHETSSSVGDENKGVIHIMPSDDNVDTDYVTIHGSGEPELIRFYTDGNVELGTINGVDVNQEIDDIETSLGTVIDTNGTFIGFAGTNKLDLTSSITDAIETIDSSVIYGDEKGAANGVVPLNSSILIDAQYLPSYVDDVVEVATYADLPVTGDVGKIYIVVADETQGGDTSSYRWTGTVYALVTNTLTATDILNLLLTVDGGTSGLDAQYLSNIPASSFLRSDIDDVVSGQLTFGTYSFFQQNSVYDNNVGVNGKVTSGSNYSIVRINASNEVSAGNATLPLALLSNGTHTVNGHPLATLDTANTFTQIQTIDMSNPTTEYISDYVGDGAKWDVVVRDTDGTFRLRAWDVTSSTVVASFNFYPDGRLRLDGAWAAKLGTLNNVSTYLHLNRNDDVNAVLYVNQTGNGDIARFYKGASSTSTYGTAMVIIENDGTVTTTGGISADGDSTFVGNVDVATINSLATSQFLRNDIDEEIVGSLTITKDGDSSLSINKTSDLLYGGLAFRYSGSKRWLLYMGNTPETGSNAGTDLYLQSRADDGSYIQNVFKVTRATGILDFYLRPTVVGDDILISTDIGTTVQGYDANTAKTDTPQTFSAMQKTGVTVSNTGVYDMITGTNDWTTTPGGAISLTFSNISPGAGGNILLDNTGGYAITKGANLLSGATFESDISVAGVYVLGYKCFGTSVYIVQSESLS